MLSGICHAAAPAGRFLTGGQIKAQEGAFNTDNCHCRGERTLQPVSSDCQFLSHKYSDMGILGKAGPGAAHQAVSVASGGGRPLLSCGNRGGNNGRSVPGRHIV